MHHGKILTAAVVAVAATLWLPSTHASAHQAAGSTACSGSQGACLQTVLATLNAERTRFHLQPLSLTLIQSNGRPGCVGSLGHSVAMAATGDIWHQKSSRPRASFPHDVCVRHTTLGENVGTSGSGNEVQDLLGLHQMMMAEPHDARTCAVEATHACNILDPAFHRVGIGVYYVNGTTWLTEDFIG